MDRREALRLIALEVVGMSNPDEVHDDEMLRWGDIREALQEDEPKTQRLCWNSGKGGHLCNKKCADEPPYGTTLDDLVAEARERQFRQYAEWGDKKIRSLYSGNRIRPSINNRVALRKFDMERRPWDE